MISYIWPVALVVLSNTIYQIAAKEVPEKMDPLASVTVTYLIGAAASFILYYALNKDANIIAEYSRLNWAPFLLGLAIIGLEAGMISAYKVGWPVNTLSVTQSTVLAIGLIAVGYIVFKEPVTWNKVAGIGVCIAGLALINYK